MDSILDIFKIPRKKAKLGGIELEVVTSKIIDQSVSVTSRRVEKGFEIADTARVNPLIISLQAVDTSLTYLNTRDQLRKLTQDTQPVEYVYSNGETYENVVVESFTETYSNEYKGLTFNINLKQIIVVEQAEEVYETSEQSGVPTGKKNKVAKSTPANSKEVGKATEVKKAEEKRSGLANLFNL